ncbi:MAG: peptide deformylase [Planctomycetes bacterium]|nr:peptide deformylase [Planctomycetota bacterium]
MKILKYPDPALTRVAEAVEAVDDQVRAMAEEMFMAMAEARGVGLAGPQLGYLRRLIVINTTPGTPDNEKAFVNPRIVWQEGEVTASEGCLSLPFVNGKVARAERIRMEAVDLQGAPVTVEADALLARILQHEIDHLDGILIFTKFSALDKAANQRALRDLERAAKETAKGIRRPAWK